MCAKVLVVGSGAREHTIAWKIKQSNLVKDVLVAPGNAGTFKYGGGISKQVPINDFQQLAIWCKDNSVDLVVVGPEGPLDAGISDILTKQGINCFGPSSAASKIESNKTFAKDFMVKYNIPTANYNSFRSVDLAIDFIEKANTDLVVKASGLAAGKGVIVCSNKNEAKEAVKNILENKAFGNAGETVVIEEKLKGEEISLLCFSDGERCAVMPCSQDHKRLLEGDVGLNTGGMGAYCPCPQVNTSFIEYIKINILQKAILGLKKEDRKFKGVLYCGLMITNEGPKILEFNCRFGDPETEVILPLLKSDLYSIMQQCVSGKLVENEVEWRSGVSALTIVLASLGYPGKYEKGKVITGIIDAESIQNVHVFEAGTTIQEDGNKVTSGGRVLAVVALAEDLKYSQELAVNAINKIKFENCMYRCDIGWRGIEFLNKHRMSYAESGVDIQAGNDFIKQISLLTKSTQRKGSNAIIGGFGGEFDLKLAGYNDPVLVSGTDGVGTKLLIAHACENHLSIGRDLVAMCVNDIVTHNAEPLFFMDYYACGKLQPIIAKKVVEGIAAACKEAGCALIGGETAEMPGMYSYKHYDLAGFAVGSYERNIHTPLPQIQEVKEGDVLIGISSTGIHSNGYSLVRKIVEKNLLSYFDKCPFESEKTLGESLLTPTAIYCKALLPLLRDSEGGVKAAAHITGGGIFENVPRVLPDDLQAELDAETWEIPPVFGWLHSFGNVPAYEMLQTFNCGLGMVLVVEASQSQKIFQKCKTRMSAINLKSFIVGKIAKRKKQGAVVRYIKNALQKSWSPPINQTLKVSNGYVNGQNQPKAKVAILISGTGTNMESIIKKQTEYYEVCLVISNKASAKGLDKAKDANIPTCVISHKKFSERELFDMEIDRILNNHSVDIVCLAGFMRLLSKEFTQKWSGKILNIHPSLLPGFKGTNAHEQVLKAGVRVTGCTVHFVTAEMDGGAIIDQAAVKVIQGDTVTSLSERVKISENDLYPKVVNLLAQNKFRFDHEYNTVIWDV